MNDYVKYRGKCKEFCEALVLENPSYNMVRGFYYDPIDNEEYQHWWCVDENGKIVDPTIKQFTCQFGTYREFDGTIECAECGTLFHEDDEDVRFESRYGVCSTKCNMRFVGLSCSTIKCIPNDNKIDIDDLFGED